MYWISLSWNAEYHRNCWKRPPCHEYRFYSVCSSSFLHFPSKTKEKNYKLNREEKAKEKKRKRTLQTTKCLMSLQCVPNRIWVLRFLNCLDLRQLRSPSSSWSHFYGRQISIAIKLTISHKWMCVHRASECAYVRVPTLFSLSWCHFLFVYHFYVIIIVIIIVNGIWFHDFMLSTRERSRAILALM